MHDTVLPDHTCAKTYARAAASHAYTSSRVYDPPKDFETPRGLPMTYIITPDGKVAKQYTGPVSARMIEEDIAKAGGPPLG